MEEVKQLDKDKTSPEAKTFKEAFKTFCEKEGNCGIFIGFDTPIQPEGLPEDKEAVNLVVMVQGNGGKLIKAVSLASKTDEGIDHILVMAKMANIFGL